MKDMTFVSAARLSQLDYIFFFAEYSTFLLETLNGVLTFLTQPEVFKSIAIYHVQTLA